MWLYNDKLCSSRATHSGNNFHPGTRGFRVRTLSRLKSNFPPQKKKEKKNSALNRELSFYGRLGLCLCRRKYIRHVRWWVSACKVRRHSFSVRDKSAARVSGNERQTKIGKYDGAISCQLIARWFWFVIWQTSAVGIAGTTLSNATSIWKYRIQSKQTHSSLEGEHHRKSVSETAAHHVGLSIHL
jgi:hypothetical protein